MQVVLLRRYEDRAVEALSCSGQAVQKVRLDFGWEGALEGEDIEGVQMEWNALCYDVTVSFRFLDKHWCCVCARLLHHHCWSHVLTHAILHYFTWDSCTIHILVLHLCPFAVALLRLSYHSAKEHVWSGHAVALWMSSIQSTCNQFAACIFVVQRASAAPQQCSKPLQSSGFGSFD